MTTLEARLGVLIGLESENSCEMLRDVVTDSKVRRQTSPVSAMPRGLLNHFSEDEIVDLLAYLLTNQKPPK